MNEIGNRWTSSILIGATIVLLYVGSLAVISRLDRPKTRGFAISRYIVEVNSYSGVIFPENTEFRGMGWIDTFYRPILSLAARDSSWDGNLVARWVLGR